MALRSGTLQEYVQPWWVKSQPAILERGRLLRTLVAFQGRVPYVLDPMGRAEDQTDHTKALVRIDSFRMRGGAPPRKLPVAALPQEAGSRFTFTSSKVRPAVVIAAPGPQPSRSASSGMARYQTAPTVLVGPYFGADQDGSRGGVPQAMLDRIRRAEYPQYMWDTLPIAGAEESYLRLDQVFPMGTDPGGFDLTDFVLSDEARAVLDEQFDWLRSGESAPPENGMLGLLRTELLGQESSSE